MSKMILNNLRLKISKQKQIHFKLIYLHIKIIFINIKFCEINS